MQNLLRLLGLSCIFACSCCHHCGPCSGGGCSVVRVAMCQAAHAAIVTTPLCARTEGTLVSCAQQKLQPAQGARAAAMLHEAAQLRDGRDAYYLRLQDRFAEASTALARSSSNARWHQQPRASRLRLDGTSGTHRCWLDLFVLPRFLHSHLVPSTIHSAWCARFGTAGVLTY